MAVSYAALARNHSRARALGGKGATVMTHFVLDVTNGPAKDELLQAVANADGQLTVMFHTSGGALETQINQIEEQGDAGVDYTLWGRLTSSELCGAHFTASYDCQSRTGRLALKEAT
jgi:NADP-dependent 3-hydroxy acid dehydrogenase YdfG